MKKIIILILIFSIGLFSIYSTNESLLGIAIGTDITVTSDVWALALYGKEDLVIDDFDYNLEVRLKIGFIEAASNIIINNDNTVSYNLSGYLNFTSSIFRWGIGITTNKLDLFDGNNWSCNYNQFINATIQGIVHFGVNVPSFYLGIDTIVCYYDIENNKYYEPQGIIVKLKALWYFI